MLQGNKLFFLFRIVSFKYWNNNMVFFLIVVYIAIPYLIRTLKSMYKDYAFIFFAAIL